MNKTIVLTLIVLSQFFGTSLWFSSNAVLKEIALAHHLNSPNLLANLTIATQIGFIIGSLCYAIFNLADRFKANLIFSLSIFLAAFSNAAITIPHLNFETIFIFRFLTGVFLAGVYPVGMKIAAYFFPNTVSKALGVLVGALVLGTAFPHFVASFHINLPWTTVILTSSSLAFIGGVLMLFLTTPAKEKIQKIDFTIIPQLFKNKKFTQASIGYFGHMWELYTFWAFVPLLISSYVHQKEIDLNTSLWSFITISSGAIGCIIAGKIALKKGSLTVSKWALYTSFTCCIISPISFYFSPGLFLFFLIVWGFSVVADSPLLSTLINKNSIPNYNGTALTLSTSIGFGITILSIYLFNSLTLNIDTPLIFLLLALGPIISILTLSKK
ncbi:MFS transporter [Wenyingzhuangia sp. IMCC45574]